MRTGQYSSVETFGTSTAAMKDWSSQNRVEGLPTTSARGRRGAARRIGYAGPTIMEIVDRRAPEESNRISLERLRQHGWTT
jgi:hypothetical protein